MNGPIPWLLVVVMAGTAMACATPAKMEDFDTGTFDMTDLGDTAWDSSADGLPDTGYDSLTDTGLTDTGLTDTGLTDTGLTDTGLTDTAGGGIVGDPCYSTTQCTGVPGSGRTCLTSLMGYITFPGGYCSAVCTSAADCGAGAQCVNLNDLGNYCLEECTTAAQCRTAETYTCSAVPGVSGTFCIPPISTTDS